MKHPDLGEKLVIVSVGGCLLLLLASISPSLVRGQSSASEDWEKAAGGRMSFDVASVKEDTSGQFFPPKFPLDEGDSYPGNMTLFTSGFPLQTDIGFAYKLSPSQNIQLRSQLPKWAQTEIFDIEARAALPSTKDQMRLMVQSLLADRFKLKARFEMSEKSVFGLVLDNPGKTGPQLRPYAEEPPCGEEAPRGSVLKPPAKIIVGEFPATCYDLALFPTTVNGATLFNWGSRNVSMRQIADDMLAAPSASLDRPVVDKTGLNGNFDFVMNYAAKPALTIDSTAADSAPTFLEALKDQLGLKLESTTAPVSSLVIDHIEEPTPN